MTDLFTYALIAIAAVGWLLALYQRLIIRRYDETLDALERRTSDQAQRIDGLNEQLRTSRANYRGQTRELVRAQAELRQLRLIYEPGTALLRDLPLHLAAQPSEN